MLSGIIFINLKLKEMRKILTVLSIVLFSTIGYSQTDSTSYVTDSNVEKLVDKYSAKIEATIVSLAEQLKQPAEHVYKIMVKQQYIKAFEGILVLLIVILFGYLTIKYASNIEDWEYGTVYENKPTYSIGAFYVSSISLFIAILVLLVGQYPMDIIQGFINPEYGAIQDIINLIK